MISLTSRSPFLTTKQLDTGISVDRAERVQDALARLSQGSVQILTSNPFRSFAAQAPMLSLPQKLHRIYSLELVKL